MTTTSALLLKHLTVKNRSGFEWLCLCPYHEDTTPSFSVNIRKKLFICYACGAKGNMAQLLQHLGVSDRPEQEEVSLDELSGKIDSVSQLVNQTVRPPVGIPVSSSWYTSNLHISDYWHRQRKLSDEAIRDYKLGYDVLADEAIIPVSNTSGHNVGVIRRTFDAERPRYLYSKGMKISEVLFGAHQALMLSNRRQTDKYGALVITEGSVDAMTVYNLPYNNGTKHGYFVGVATMGSRMSKPQAQMVKRLGFQEVIIATDMDRAGRVAAMQILNELRSVQIGSFVYIADWKIDWGKDLNALGSETASEVLHRAMHPDTLFDVYANFIKRD